MDELQQAKDIAIGLGGSITDNGVGFITCFATALVADHYVTLVNDFETLTAERQDRCAIVINISSLL
ncbi:MAG: hypothetical protein AAF808_01255 [Cyanobacteria bacterium P01_D01_bin.2]